MADIEIAQSLKAESEKAKEEMMETVPHPIDQDYQSLKCNLTLMDKKSKEFKVYMFMFNTVNALGRNIIFAEHFYFNISSSFEGFIVNFS